MILFLLTGLAEMSMISTAAASSVDEPTDVITPTITKESEDTQAVVMPAAIPANTRLTNANWIHGTATNAEYPRYLYNTFRKGWGTTYVGKNNTFNWFHFAIPTTVISNGMRNKVAKTFVLFKTDGNAKITNVTVWDGPSKIKAYDGISRSGDHSSAIDSSNTFVIDPPSYVYWGVGISVGVEFGSMNTKGIRPAILFTTAGEDLYQFGSASDSDGDALRDSWEAYGYDYNNDGVVDVNLPAKGADPFHKDAFVEVDWMAQGPGETRSHFPLSGVMSRAVTTFAKAPYANNPDGKAGINLHIELSNQVPHDFDLKPVWTEFNAIKAANFPANRQDIYHYAIFGHGYDGDTSSGISNGIPASDFLVTLGTWGSGDTADAETGTFIHEFGHNLGLKHGGDDHNNYKPNYLSIMNYLFQIPGVYRNGVWGNYDYQRTTPYILNENSLNESKGIGTSGYGTKWFSPGCAHDENGRPTTSPKTSTVYKPIDWNWNGGVQNSVAVDINCDLSKTVLNSQNNWQNIIYNGGSIGGVGAGKTKQILTAEEMPKELTYEENLNITKSI
jgi:hypothetical protein